MSIHRVAGVDMIDAMRSPLAQPARDHVEGFGARMGVHRCLGLRRSGPLVETQQILGRGDCRQGPDLGDLAAPGRRGILGTQRDHPDLAGDFSNQRRRCLIPHRSRVPAVGPHGGFRICKRGEIFDPPEALS